ncbi:ABC transporter ATP-binding protein [Merismopedia glauca]|uniref:Cobalamin/Fe(3+)-siderophore ABC transporter ATP-binding protein n=1 Tax=Merismopedia glauca CCAP 1448/3 TaxID=1296344 RepID=A0A2T1C0G3_9CYAN|nr:ABC transporter ATP-binding protein [Merismopedia glauca]PSB01751.1 cobalamin/Fe(3+)-siderophore ABC transporter ATP-binding protein [Merismopedia glauca CCAP 1448/3]
MNQLSAQNLTLGYDRSAIIRNLELDIPPGKITALVGANGCGKSTLLRGLARLLKPKTGAVYLNGESLAKLPTKTVAKELGILPQSPSSPEGLTVRDLVAQGRFPHQSWLHQWSKEDERLVELALNITRMSELQNRALDSLSGGQRQRAWIAMALAQDTNILLLDEPTTFLDLAHQIEILDLLYDLNQSQGRTIVMVLHDLNQACRYADYLVAMFQGYIFAQGFPVEVMTQETIREVFGLECRVLTDPVSDTPMCVPIGRKAMVRSKE